MDTERRAHGEPSACTRAINSDLLRLPSPFVERKVELQIELCDIEQREKLSAHALPYRSGFRSLSWRICLLQIFAWTELDFGSQNIQVSRGKCFRFLKSNHFQASERVCSADVAFQAHALAEDWVAVRSRSGGHLLLINLLSSGIRRCVEADAVPRPPVALNILSCFLLSSLTHQTTESFPLLKARNQILFRKLPPLPSFRCYRRCW